MKEAVCSFEMLAPTGQTALFHNSQQNIMPYVNFIIGFVANLKFFKIFMQFHVENYWNIMVNYDFGLHQGSRFVA